MEREARITTGRGSQSLARILGGRGRQDRARRLLEHGDLAELSRMAPRELAVRFALPHGAASRLSAAFDLGRRVEQARRPPRASMRTAARIHLALAPDLRGLRRERFMALLLDGKHRLKRAEVVSEGTLTTSLVHPREVFRSAVSEAAAALVVAHNHPSGDPEPSPEDFEVTRRLIAAGALLGIPLLDHLVVADCGFVSMRERMDFVA